MMKSKGLLLSSIFIGTTILLKISGLVRDIVIAYYFGDSYMADAYLAAFIIPGMVFLFISHGMKNTFVPGYINALEKRNASSYFTKIFKSSFFFHLIIGFIFILSAPYMIQILYPTFSPEATNIATW